MIHLFILHMGVIVLQQLQRPIKIYYTFFWHTKYIILNSNTIGWIKYFKLVIINGVWGIIIRCLLHCWCNIISRCKLAAPKNPRKWSWHRKQLLEHLMCVNLNISRLCINLVSFVTKLLSNQKIIIAEKNKKNSLVYPTYNVGYQYFIEKIDLKYEFFKYK
jgi:hypothetical protein